MPIIPSPSQVSSPTTLPSPPTEASVSIETSPLSAPSPFRDSPPSLLTPPRDQGDDDGYKTDHSPDFYSDPRRESSSKPKTEEVKQEENMNKEQKDEQHNARSLCDPGTGVCMKREK